MFDWHDTRTIDLLPQFNGIPEVSSLLSQLHLDGEVFLRLKLCAVSVSFVYSANDFIILCEMAKMPSKHCGAVTRKFFDLGCAAVECVSNSSVLHWFCWNRTNCFAKTISFSFFLARRCVKSKKGCLKMSGPIR